MIKPFLKAMAGSEPLNLFGCYKVEKLHAFELENYFHDILERGTSLQIHEVSGITGIPFVVVRAKMENILIFY